MADEVKTEETKAEKPKAEAPAAEAEPTKAEEKKPKAAKAEKAKSSSLVDEALELFDKMNVMELADLVKRFSEKYGVSAAAPVAVAAAAPSAEAAGGGEVEEQTEFTVILTEIGENKINVIRAVRELTTLGLKESKDLVEGAPKPVKEGVTKEEAANAKSKLEAAGAKAEVK